MNYDNKYNIDFKFSADGMQLENLRVNNWITGVDYSYNQRPLSFTFSPTGYLHASKTVLITITGPTAGATATISFIYKGVTILTTTKVIPEGGEVVVAVGVPDLTYSVTVAVPGFVTGTITSVVMAYGSVPEKGITLASA